jgi:hypothetical protein
MISRDAERQELERAIELLGRSTRPGRLLAYIGAKYFDQQEEQLTEFNIAMEVFGRSPKTFDSAQDAVVRVEAHRLRKKLREIYAQGNGAGNLQISLPAATYVPKFSLVSDDETLSTQPTADTDHDAQVSIEGEPSVSAVRTRKWGLYGSVAVALIAAVTFALFMVRRSSSTGNESADSPATQPQMATSLPNDAVSEVHVMAGYSGSEVIDNSGIRWTPDRFYIGGAPWPRDGGFIRATSRPFLFANWRSGEFGYDIPVKPGTYELRLFFISPFRPGDEKLASFSATLNGQPLLTTFDVNVSANGPDTADEKVFRDVVPDKDGFVRLRFTNEMTTPSLSGIEITPGVRGKLQPIRIITQPTSFVDHKDQRWRADDYYINGMRWSDHRKVNGTDDPELFGGERYGHFSYVIPVDTRGRYTVILHFAEFYFGPQLQGGGGVGSRVFNVFCNGQTLLQNFDIYKEGGSLQVVTKRFASIKPSAQGKINLTFEPVTNNATVSAIEVLDESQ